MEEQDLLTQAVELCDTSEKWFEIKGYIKALRTLQNRAAVTEQKIKQIDDVLDQSGPQPDEGDLMYGNANF